MTLAVASAGAVGVIAYLALRPSPWIGEISWIPSWLGHWADRYGNFRNFPAFAVLAGILALFAGVRWGSATAALLAIALEVAQVWVGGRTFDWADIGWSLGGVGFAVLLYQVIVWIRK